MTTLSTTKPIISCHCSLETYSFFFKSSFATAEFRGCSCCEDKNITGSNQRPFELTQQTMKLCVTSRAILHLMTAQQTHWSRVIQHLMTAQPTHWSRAILHLPDDRSTNQPGHWSRAIQLMMTAPLIASHPTPDDRSTYQPGQRSWAIQLMMTAPLIASHPTPDGRSTNQPGQRSRAIQLMMTAPLITSLLVHTQHLMTAQLTVQWTPLPLRYHLTTYTYKNTFIIIINNNNYLIIQTKTRPHKLLIAGAPSFFTAGALSFLTGGAPAKPSHEALSFLTARAPSLLTAGAPSKPSHSRSTIQAFSQ